MDSLNQNHEEELKIILEKVSELFDSLIFSLRPAYLLKILS